MKGFESWKKMDRKGYKELAVNAEAHRTIVVIEMEADKYLVKEYKTAWLSYRLRTEKDIITNKKALDEKIKSTGKRYFVYQSDVAGKAKYVKDLLSI